MSDNVFWFFRQIVDTSLSHSQGASYSHRGLSSAMFVTELLSGPFLLLFEGAEELSTPLVSRLFSRFSSMIIFKQCSPSPFGLKRKESCLIFLQDRLDPSPYLTNHASLSCYEDTNCLLFLLIVVVGFLSLPVDSSLYFFFFF